MLGMFLSGILKLLNLGNWVGEFLHDGKIEKQAETKIELRQTSQELNDVVKAQEFDNAIRNNPDAAERMRLILNKQK